MAVVVEVVAVSNAKGEIIQAVVKEMVILASTHRIHAGAREDTPNYNPR